MPGPHPRLTLLAARLHVCVVLTSPTNSLGYPNNHIWVNVNAQTTVHTIAQVQSKQSVANVTYLVGTRDATTSVRGTTQIFLVPKKKPSTSG